MSDKRVIFRPGVSKTERRVKWVELVPAQDDKPAEGVYVREFATCDSLQIIERISQMGVDENSGVAQARKIQLSIMLSCYDSDQPGARRVFSDADVAPINEGAWGPFQRIINAIGEVNGTSEAEAAAVKDFLPAPPAPSSSE